MSIAVPIPELAAAAAEYDYAFVVSVGAEGEARVLSLRPVWRGGDLLLDLGRTGRANAEVRPSLTLVYPAADPAGFSLIVDGTAIVEPDAVVFTPSWAVLHRPAPHPPVG